MAKDKHERLPWKENSFGYRKRVMVCEVGNLKAEVIYPNEVRLHRDGILVEVRTKFRTWRGLGDMSSSEQGMAIARRWIRKQLAEQKGAVQ